MVPVPIAFPAEAQGEGMSLEGLDQPTIQHAAIIKETQNESFGQLKKPLFRLFGFVVFCQIALDCRFMAKSARRILKNWYVLGQIASPTNKKWVSRKRHPFLKVLVRFD